MKTKFFTCFIAILLSFSFAYGQKIEKELGEIKKLDLTGGIYTLKQGDSKIIYNGANDEILNMIYYSIKQTLNIQTSSNVELYLNDIENINIKEVAKLSIVDTFFTNYLKIKVDEASKADIVVNCDTLELIASEASYIKASGRCKYLKINADEASYVNAAKLEAQCANVLASEASGASVIASDSLNITAKEASYITYFGKPNHLKFTKEEFSFIIKFYSLNFYNKNNVMCEMIFCGALHF